MFIGKQFFSVCRISLYTIMCKIHEQTKAYAEMTFDDKEQCSKSKVQSNNTEQNRLNKTFKEIISRSRYHAGFKINGKTVDS